MQARSPGIAPALLRWLHRNRESLPASLALHALLAVVALLAFPVHPPQPPPPPESMSVEVLTPEEFARLSPAAPNPLPPPPKPETAAPPAAPVLPPTPRDLVAPRTPLAHAPTILSGGAIDRVARASLRSLDGDARFEQLCDIEALEQVARAQKNSKPEKAVAYAVKDTRIEGDTLVAEGGAYLSRGHWYHLAFRCRATPDRRRVLSFDFATGEQFPDDDPSLPTGGDD